MEVPQLQLMPRGTSETGTAYHQARDDLFRRLDELTGAVKAVATELVAKVQAARASGTNADERNLSNMVMRSLVPFCTSPAVA